MGSRRRLDYSPGRGPRHGHGYHASSDYYSPYRQSQRRKNARHHHNGYDSASEEMSLFMYHGSGSEDEEEYYNMRGRRRQLREAELERERQAAFEKWWQSIKILRRRVRKRREPPKDGLSLAERILLQRRLVEETERILDEEDDYSDYSDYEDVPPYSDDNRHAARYDINGRSRESSASSYLSATSTPPQVASVREREIDRQRTKEENTPLVRKVIDPSRKDKKHNNFREASASSYESAKSTLSRYSSKEDMQVDYTRSTQQNEQETSRVAKQYNETVKSEIKEEHVIHKVTEYDQEASVSSTRVSEEKSTKRPKKHKTRNASQTPPATQATQQVKDDREVSSAIGLMNGSEEPLVRQKTDTCLVMEGKNKETEKTEIKVKQAFLEEKAREEVVNETAFVGDAPKRRRSSKKKSKAERIKLERIETVCDMKDNDSEPALSGNEHRETNAVQEKKVKKEKKKKNKHKKNSVNTEEVANNVHDAPDTDDDSANVTVNTKEISKERKKKEKKEKRKHAEEKVQQEEKESDLAVLDTVSPDPVIVASTSAVTEAKVSRKEEKKKKKRQQTVEDKQAEENIESSVDISAFDASAKVESSVEVKREHKLQRKASNKSLRAEKVKKSKEDKNLTFDIGNQESPVPTSGTPDQDIPDGLSNDTPEPKQKPRKSKKLPPKTPSKESVESDAPTRNDASTPGLAAKQPSFDQQAPPPSKPGKSKKKGRSSTEVEQENDDFPTLPGRRRPAEDDPERAACIKALEHRLDRNLDSILRPDSAENNGKNDSLDDDKLNKFGEEVEAFLAS